ncbi:MAG: FtsX-like permease family protein [Pseudomonadales bacterium]|nr:FtsX-like permease family protein [Pseudomonadales bacterium]
MRPTLHLIHANFLSILDRKENAFVTLLGVAVVVGVMASTMMMTRAVTETMNGSSRDDHFIILQKGAVVESMSSITRDLLGRLGQLPALKTKHLETHFLTGIIAERIDTQSSSTISVRGTLSTFDAIKITNGRLYRPGQHELVIGNLAAIAFRDLNVGDAVVINGTPWQIVGEFQGRGMNSSELRGDLPALMDVLNSTSYTSVRLKLTADEKLAVSAALDEDPRLTLDLLSEREFFTVGTSTVLFEFVSYVVAGIMAAGATFAAINLMYTSIDTRTTEIATLRSIGFTPQSIAASVLAGSAALCLIGGLLGLGVSAALFANSTYTSGSMESIVAPLTVTQDVVISALAWSISIGVFAGIPPSIRAARMQIADALR